MTVRYIIGDTRDVTATIPDQSIDLIMTSPPFLALRSYLPQDHPDKGREIGSEATPAAFIDMLLELTAEWGRVLAPHGSICVELGDTYSGSSQGGGDLIEGSGNRHNPGKLSTVDTHTNKLTRAGDGWPLAKSKALIPELYRIALAYGVNPLTGQPSPAGRWRVRNVVTWARPNPPVGALGDKYRPATSDLVIACRAADRWFDLDAVRGPASPNTHQRLAKGAAARNDLPSRQRDGNWGTLPEVDSDPEAGAPPLDYWIIPPGGYTGSHYAVYPPELCRIPIQSMCPRHVCTTCGKPRRRITEKSDEYATYSTNWESGVKDGKGAHTTKREMGVPARLRSQGAGGMTADMVTVGWTDCGCLCDICATSRGPWSDRSINPTEVDLVGYCSHKYRPGIVLDPFAGSGTTLLVAHGNSRDAIGIDIDHRNADLATERLGMFITIETHGQDAA
jgi:hypothetical protein